MCREMVLLDGNKRKCISCFRGYYIDKADNVCKEIPSKNSDL